MKNKELYEKLLKKKNAARTYRPSAETQKAINEKRIDFEKNYPFLEIINADVVNATIKNKLKELTNEEILKELDKD